MTHVVQFTTLGAFVEDLAGGTVAGIYHELIEQRTAVGQYGSSRWLLTTVIRAIVGNGNVMHVAALTIPHGHEVERLYGRIIGPFGEEAEAGRWQDAREQHEVVVDELTRRLLPTPMRLELIRSGIVNVPADMSFVLAPHPRDEVVEQDPAMVMVTPDHPDWDRLQEVLYKQDRAQRARQQEDTALED